MSEPSEPGRSSVGQSDLAPAAAGAGGDTEEIDALPVLADGPTVLHPYPVNPAAPPTYWRSTGVAIPAVQAAAVAAGGFVAGAAVVGLVQRRSRHASAPSKGHRIARRSGRGSRGKRGASKAGELVQIVSSRSLLVDVHLLAGRD